MNILRCGSGSKSLSTTMIYIIKNVWRTRIALHKNSFHNNSLHNNIKLITTTNKLITKTTKFIITVLDASFIYIYIYIYIYGPPPKPPSFGLHKVLR